jgi:hypothetical protein
MNTAAPSALMQWRSHATNASNTARLAIARSVTSFNHFGATWEAGVAAIATWLFRLVGRVARRLEAWGSEEPRTPQELLALARSLERTQPNLAAELRFIAMHRRDDTESRSPS